MKKISYAELKSLFSRHEETKPDTHLTGYIVFTEDSFQQFFPLEARTYRVSSDNKAYIPFSAGYSIWGCSLDNSDPHVRLERYMAAEAGGERGWKVDYCYMDEE